jgi:inorganic triphosphatase YgiF
LALRMIPSDENAEVELKLAVDADDLPRLEAHPLLRTRAKARTLVSTYFDTADQRLRKAGYSLRIRSDGRGRVQTIKASGGGSAGLFARSEWERDVATARPDRDSLKDTPLEALLPDEAALKALRPLFTVKVARTVRVIEQDGSEIEVAFDKGTVAAGGETQPLHELELELKRGSPDALFALAARLFEAPPLRLSTRSKAQAGFALLAPPKSSVKAKDVVLTRAMTVAEAFQAIGGACVAHFAANEPLVRLDRSPEALHQARIALRRMRAAMSLFGPLVADEASQRLKAEMRRVAGVLGEARDLDVFKERLGEAGAGAAATLEARRLAAYDRVGRMLEAGPGARLPFEVVAWLQAGDWLVSDDPELAGRRDAPVAGFAAEVLARRRARVRKQAPRLRKMTPEQRHEVRIAVKKLRYASEFFASLAADGKAQKRARAFAAALRPLQEALGELNDLAVQEAMSAAIDPALARTAAERRLQDEPAALARAEEAAAGFAEARSFLQRSRSA